MICCSADEPDCRHLEKHGEYMACGALGFETIVPWIDGCPHYEASGEYALRVALQEELDNIDKTFKEFDKWRDRCIRWGVNLGIIVLVAYMIFFWWMFTW